MAKDELINSDLNFNFNFKFRLNSIIIMDYSLKLENLALIIVITPKGLKVLI